MKKREIIRIARALLSALKQVPEKEQEHAAREFLGELKRIHKLPERAALLRAIEHVWVEMFGPKTVSLTTAHRVPAHLKEAVAQFLPHAELKSVIDPRLMGGATLRVGDRIIDSSISGTLDRMRATLV